MRSSSTCGAVALAALATILLGAGSCCAVAVPTLSVVLGHGFGLENVVTVYIYIYHLHIANQSFVTRASHLTSLSV
jgi:hypothetical protein